MKVPVSKSGNKLAIRLIDTDIILMSILSINKYMKKQKFILGYTIRNYSWYSYILFCAYNNP